MSYIQIVGEKFYSSLRKKNIKKIKRKIIIIKKLLWKKSRQPPSQNFQWVSER